MRTSVRCLSFTKESGTEQKTAGIPKGNGTGAAGSGVWQTALSARFDERPYSNGERQLL